MACPQQNNIRAKRTKNLAKYRQLAFKMREQCPGYKIYVVPVVVGALGGGIKALKVDLKKIFNNELLEEVVAVMQKTVLMNTESIIQRAMSGLIQREDNK